MGIEAMHRCPSFPHLGASSCLSCIIALSFQLDCRVFFSTSTLPLSIISFHHLLLLSSLTKPNYLAFLAFLQQQPLSRGFLDPFPAFIWWIRSCRPCSASCRGMLEERNCACSSQLASRETAAAKPKLCMRASGQLGFSPQIACTSQDLLDLRCH